MTNVSTEYTIRIKDIPEEPVIGKRLGRRVRHDSRSLNFLVPEVPLTDVRTRLWDRTIAAFDQGDLGSCTGNAATGALATIPNITPLQALVASGALQLNEAEAVKLYSAATALDNYQGTYPPTDTGSDGLSVAKAAQQAGLISGYNHATSLNAMISALQTGPVIVGTNWYEGMDNPDAGGIVETTGQVRGGHEWEVLGVDVENRLFTAINSWGPSWGLDGRFKISFDDMTKLLGEDGDCTQFVPLSGSSPTPPPAPPAPSEDADTALWDVAGPWVKPKRYRSDLKTLQSALKTWAAAKGKS